MSFFPDPYEASHDRYIFAIQFEGEDGWPSMEISGSAWRCRPFVLAFHIYDNTL